jgi:hypothetical protein
MELKKVVPLSAYNREAVPAYFQGLPCQGKGSPLYLNRGIGGYNEIRKYVSR